jgi:hypothetical protein
MLCQWVLTVSRDSQTQRSVTERYDHGAFGIHLYVSVEPTKGPHGSIPPNHGPTVHDVTKIAFQQCGMAWRSGSFDPRLSLNSDLPGGRIRSHAYHGGPRLR